MKYPNRILSNVKKFNGDHTFCKFNRNHFFHEKSKNTLSLSKSYK